MVCSGTQVSSGEQFTSLVDLLAMRKKAGALRVLLQPWKICRWVLVGVRGTLAHDRVRLCNRFYLRISYFFYWTPLNEVNNAFNNLLPVLSLEEKSYISTKYCCFITLKWKQPLRRQSSENYRHRSSLILQQACASGCTKQTWQRATLCK